MQLSIDKKINDKLNYLFDFNVPQYVSDRVMEELEFFSQKNCLEFIDYLSNYLDELEQKLGQKNAFHPRSEVGYSFVLYLLGINDLNPLPRLLPKDINNIDDKELILDGYDLDFEIFKMKFESLKETLSLSYCKESNDILFNNHVCHLVHDRLTELTFANNYLIPEYQNNTRVIDILEPYEEYIDSLLPKSTYELMCKYAEQSWMDYSNFVKVLALSRGQNVIDANELIHLEVVEDMIVSVDDLFELLSNSIEKKEAIEICKIACSKQRLSDEKTDYLKEAGVNENIILFINECQYLYTRGGAYSEAKSILKLCDIKSKEPDTIRGIHL